MSEMDKFMRATDVLLLLLLLSSSYRPSPKLVVGRLCKSLATEFIFSCEIFSEMAAKFVLKGCMLLLCNFLRDSAEFSLSCLYSRCQSLIHS
jgi:hypothetical protein